MRVIEQARLVGLSLVQAEALLWPGGYVRVIDPEETVHKGSDLSGDVSVAPHHEDHPNTG